MLKFPRAKYVPLLKDEKHRTDEKTSYSFPNSQNLYGLRKAKEAIEKTGIAIVFEGAKSVMLARHYGHFNSICTHTYGIHDNHISMLLECGAKEIILGFDKQYQDELGKQWELYEHKTRGIAARVSGYVEVSRLIDRNNQLDYKDAPIDKGEAVFERLLENRENISDSKEAALPCDTLLSNDIDALFTDEIKAKSEKAREKRIADKSEAVKAEEAAFIEEFLASQEAVAKEYRVKQEQTKTYNAFAAKGQSGFDDLLIQRKDKSTNFLLPNEGNKEVTAYEIIKRLSGNAFKSYRKQEKFKNSKIQILSYAERIRLIFYFRRQHKNPPILENAETIAAFINTAIKHTDDRKLRQNWYACLEATQTQEEAASLFVYYGWAATYDKEFPRTEDAFYKVSKQDGKRHYSIVKDDIILRLEAIERKGREWEVLDILTDKEIDYEKKCDKLKNLLSPLLWGSKELHDDRIRLALTTQARELCEERISEYIDNLFFGKIEHIDQVEIDKSDTGIIFAEPRQFTVSIDDMEFSDYKHNINAEYNKQNAAALGAARSKKSAERNFEHVTGDEWTTQELYAQGIDKDKIARLVDKKIERVTQGFYRRIF